MCIWTNNIVKVLGSPLAFGARIASLVTVQTAPEMYLDIDPEGSAQKSESLGLLPFVVSALEGKDCKEPMRAIAESSDLSEEQLTSLISGMYTLLREALRLPISTFKQEVSTRKEFIMDFASVVFGNRRPVVEATTLKQGNRLPSVNDIKWRVDVAISTSSLARALQPSILMLLKLSDGTAHRFEVPVAKFQELRYNVALILKEMNDLEKRSILKIQD
uniref:COMM domain-containing protein 5 n=1 Tax=Pelusios castaneus TaxID=367368 RepID=A0A8C8R777_9SAUR